MILPLKSILPGETFSVEVTGVRITEVFFVIYQVSYLIKVHKICLMFSTVRTILT